MMKILRLLAMLFICGNVFSQAEVQVVSMEDNEPVPFARVEIISPEGSSFQSTDERGIFKFYYNTKYKYSQYSLKITAYGFESYEFKMESHHPAQCPLRPIANTVDEVVVTGQIALTTTENAVHKVRVIDSKTIESKGAVNLRDVLQSELNIRLSQDQMLGSGMSLQGLSGENVKILIDGVPVIGRMNGDVDLSQVNLANIERIEIVEGPLSVNYGSNALAGTINLITKKTVKIGQQYQLNSYYETVGNYNLDGRVVFNKKRHKFSVFGGRNYFDGWSPSDPVIQFPKSRPADSSRVKSWKPKEQYTAGVNYSYIVKRTTISPYAESFWETMTNRGMPRAPYRISAFDDYYRTQRHDQGVHIVSLIGDKYKVQGVIAHNFYERIKNTYVKDLTDLTETLSPSASDQDTSMFRTIMSRATFAKSRAESKLNYEVGYDINYDISKGKRITGNKQTMGDYALFGSAEWQAFKNFVVKPALRGAYNSTYGMSAIPSVNIKYSPKMTSIRVSYASGYRAPSMKELYMDFVDINHNIVGNAALTPEKSDNFQAWVGRKVRVRNTEFDFELNGFFQDVRDKIMLSVTPENATNYSYFNLDKFNSAGGRFQAGFKSRDFTAKAGMAYTGVKTLYGNGKYTFSPEVNLSLSYFWPLSKINFFVYYKYTGKLIQFIRTDDAQLSESFISDYNMLDASINRDFWKKRINLSVGAKNLLNVTSVTSSSSSGGVHSGGSGATPIGWGRSYYIKLQLKFDTFKK